MYDRDQLFIDGKWTGPESDAAMSVVSPHSEAVIRRAACAGPRMHPAERIEALTRLVAPCGYRPADSIGLNRGALRWLRS